jgi:hypothetical protein
MHKLFPTIPLREWLCEGSDDILYFIIQQWQHFNRVTTLKHQASELPCQLPYNSEMQTVSTTAAFIRCLRKTCQIMNLKHNHSFQFLVLQHNLNLGLFYCTDFINWYSQK